MVLRMARPTRRKESSFIQFRKRVPVDGLKFPYPQTLGRNQGAGLSAGAQGRNRTTDTVIFSHVLYRLSYLGVKRGASVRARRQFGGL
jgi:hypothetical protein